jgi:Flp pilus assembly protein TadG
MLLYTPAQSRSPAGGRPKPTPRPQRRGIAAIELAVLITLLAFLVLGMYEVSRGIRAKVVISDAARAGCRAAILPGSSNSSVTIVMNSILKDNGLTPGNAQVTVQVNDVVADASTAKQNDKVAVTVAYPISQVFLTGTLYLPPNANFTETVVMMRQR